MNFYGWDQVAVAHFESFYFSLSKIEFFTFEILNFHFRNSKFLLLKFEIVTFEIRNFHFPLLKFSLLNIYKIYINLINLSIHQSSNLTLTSRQNDPKTPSISTKADLKGHKETKEEKSYKKWPNWSNFTPSVMAR